MFYRITCTNISRVLIGSALAVIALLALTTLRASAAVASTIVVTTNADETTNGDGCSLREAIQNADDNAQTYPDCAGGAGTDTIAFDINGGGPQTITFSEQIGVAITGIIASDPVIIDGTTQPGCASYPCIELNAADITGPVITLTGGNSTVRGLVINRGGDGVAGIYIPASSGNIIAGNFIGTDMSGANGLGNQTGIIIGNGTDAAGDNFIGGLTVGDRNVISGNRSNGIEIEDNAAGNFVEGNYVGTDATGTYAIPNGGTGVSVNSNNNTIGGGQSNTENLISGNTGVGVMIAAVTSGQGSYNIVDGNFIGTDATVEKRLPNGSDGVNVTLGTGNIIGGSLPGTTNWISGNNGNGVELSHASGNSVLGNVIGADWFRKSSLANLGDGVRVEFGHGNAIGGTSTGSGNLIAFNGKKGVVIGTSKNETGTIRNPIERNRIFSNGGLGIDLANNGVTFNDTGDADMGPNNLQNFPFFKSATSSTSTLTGRLVSKPGTSYRLEFFANPACDSSGYGEGKRFLGARTVTTNGSGVAAFTYVSAHFKAGEAITATATDPHGNTSEFSKCITAS